MRGRIHWIHANVTELAAADVTGPYELILIAFLHLPAADRRALLLRAVDMLAPEGTLLIIGNDTLNLAEGYGGEQNPALTFTPADILADLAPAEPDIRVRLADRVHRPTESRDAIDALVVATKPAPEPRPSNRPSAASRNRPPWTSSSRTSGRATGRSRRRSPRSPHGTNAPVRQ